MITGLVFTLAATWSDVSTSCPHRWASANHASAWMAIVIRLFAATVPPRGPPSLLGTNVLPRAPFLLAVIALVTASAMSMPCGLPAWLTGRPRWRRDPRRDFHMIFTVAARGSQPGGLSCTAGDTL